MTSRTLSIVRPEHPSTSRLVALVDGFGLKQQDSVSAFAITDHHPRSEDPAAIRATLAEGARMATDLPEIYEISLPEAAIRAAVGMAREGDSILWAGPGHQDSREIRGVRTPYSAREEACQALSEAGRA